MAKQLLFDEAARHALKNAAIPTITVIGLQMGWLLGGAVISEAVFAYPGMGTLFILGLGNLDYNIMQGVFLMTTISVLLANFLMELIYPIFDPRARRE